MKDFKNKLTLDKKCYLNVNVVVHLNECLEIDGYKKGFCFGVRLGKLNRGFVNKKNLKIFKTKSFTLSLYLPETGAELMRPYLHEFLTSAYEVYSNFKLTFSLILQT